MNTIVEIINECAPRHTDKYYFRRIIQDKRVIVYGVGEGLNALKRSVLERYRATVDYYVDLSEEKLSRLKVEESKILTPGRLRNLPNKSDYLVLITIGSDEVSLSIRNELSRLGFTHIVTATNLYEFAVHSPVFPLEEEVGSFFLGNVEEISYAYLSLADKESRQIMESLIRWYCSGCPAVIPTRPFKEQYLLPNELTAPFTPTAYYNIGGFDGNTVISVVDFYLAISKVTVFEPSLINFSTQSNTLRNYSSKLYSVGRNIEILNIPIGLSDKLGFENFELEAGQSARPSRDSTESALFCKFDDLAFDTNKSILTVDTEGSEISILEGASSYIRSNSPLIAISVYHSPSDLWKVLLKIQSLNKSYKYYLRNYTGFTYETVLYACPRNG
jgi:FkbM family methyltransferase